MVSKLDMIKYDENVALIHFDLMRRIYAPEKILGGLDGKWYIHNIIVFSQDGLKLGGHFHDYTQVFFTLTGIFDFKLIDIDNLETKRYSLAPGSRIVIPEKVGHIIKGGKENILIGYGSVPFNPERSIPCSKQLLNILESVNNSKSF